VTARSNGIMWAVATTAAPWGVYEIDSDLPAGTYVLHATAAGHSAQVEKDIAVNSGTTTYVNF
jgi:hypothetical protein